MHQGRKAFTLIELLVVISIIAILASILFPVFAQAKLAAKKTADLSNFKQASLGILMYTNDYDDAYPLDMFWNVNTPYQDSYAWSSQVCVQPYIKNVQIYDCPVDPNQIGAPTSYYPLAANRPVAFQSFMANAFSPAQETYFVSPQYPQGVTAPQGLMPNSYSMPPCQDSYCTTNVTTTTTTPPQPATIVLLAGGYYEYYNKFYGCGTWLNDELDWCYSGYGVSQQYVLSLFVLATPNDPWYLGWRKFAGQSNFSFGDGHAKTLPPGAMTDPARWLINPPAGDTYSG